MRPFQGIAPRNASLTAVVGLALVLSACNDIERTLGVTEVPRASPGALRAVDPERLSERGMVELANRVPEFGGYYFERDGPLVVWVRDRGQADAATSGVRDLLQRRLIRHQRSASPAIVIRDARFTFRQLAEWRDRVFESVLGNVPEVLSLDLDESANRVLIGLDHRAPPTLQHSLLARLAAMGVDTMAIVFEATSPVELASAPPSVNSQASEMAGGLQITLQKNGGYPGCTLGAIAQRGSTRGFLTASHCSAEMGSTDYTPAAQLSFPWVWPYGIQIGYETYDRPWYMCGVSPCVNADASFWELQSGVASELGLILRTTAPVSYTWGVNGSFTVDAQNPYWKITEEDFVGLSPGGNVYKLGATTGWTGGYVTHTCTDRYVLGVPWIVRCSTEMNAFGDHGDSGGPVFFPTGRDNEVVFLGIFWGMKGDLICPCDRTFYSDYWRIWGDLKPLNVLRPATLGIPVLTGSISSGSAVISWNAVSGATTYHIYRVYSDGRGWENPVYLGATSNLYNLDLGANVRRYLGTTYPRPDVAAYAYYIYAASTYDWSYYSEERFFEAVYQPWGG